MQVKSKFCRTKIVCTLGPASDSEEIVRALIKEGLDCARFNFSHGTHPEHLERIKRFRRVEKEFGLKLPCMLDTKGPEIRLGKFAEPVILKEGQKYTLTTKEVPGDINQATVSHKGITKDLKPGDTVLIDDGLVELTVDNLTETDVVCTVKNTGKISSNKGVNLPGIKTTLPSLTEKDIGDLKFGVENGFDFVAGSFIRTKEDCLNIKKYLKEFGGEHIKLIVKIENQEGLDNFDDILTACEGVMVARGDLGVEIPVERIPIEQKKMIRKCNKAGKFVITATQMLDSMITNPRPTRAEVTDVSNAIIDGSSCVMLSGETAGGKYPVEATATMNRIAIRMEESLEYKQIFLTKGLHHVDSATDAIAHATVQLAYELNAKAIITPTKSGYTTRIVSKYRPKADIIAFAPNYMVARHLNLRWGVYTIPGTPWLNPEEMIKFSAKSSLDHGIVEKGDLAILTSGIKYGEGGTSSIQLHTI